MRDILDLETYPIDRPEGAAFAVLVDRCREALENDGMFNLVGFLKPAVVAEEVARLTPSFASHAFVHSRRHNIYFRKEIEGLPPGHPALTEVETTNRTLCADQIAGSTLLRLYDWSPFAGFLAATMSKERLYTMDDPLARVNVMAYRAGEALNWHFDRSEFTTTLLLEAPLAGGEFEYRSNLRSESDPNYEGVARLLRGEDPKLRRLMPSPGTLNVFKGRNTAHRVTPVEGDRPRIIAVFSFYDRPGVRFSAEEQRGFYGRAA